MGCPGECKTSLIIIIITKTMFIVVSSYQSRCESSPGSFDECRMAPSDCRPKTKPDDLGCESACTCCQKLHPPSLLLLCVVLIILYVDVQVFGWFAAVAYIADLIFAVIAYRKSDVHHSETTAHQETTTTTTSRY